MWHAAAAQGEVETQQCGVLQPRPVAGRHWWCQLRLLRTSGDRRAVSVVQQHENAGRCRLSRLPQEAFSPRNKVLEGLRGTDRARSGALRLSKPLQLAAGILIATHGFHVTEGDII